MDQQKLKLPVTVISGFLGSGKTTLLNYLLSLKHKYRVAVLVNDMGEVNVDAELIASGQLNVRQTKEKLVELHNGCICCTLREDLMRETAKLSRSGKYDYLLIESTGIAEPLPIAQAFTFENEQIKQKGLSLKPLARLDTMVTVIDASNFLNQLKSSEHFQELDMQQRMGEVPLSQLLLDQVEFANVIVLNKTDLVSDATQLAYIRELVHRLNPTAKVLESQHGRIKPQEIINTHLFNIDEAQTTTKWVQELQKPFHASETEEYNIQSTAFIARRPFHPQRILDLINTNESSQPGFWTSVLRAKGFMWIARKDSFKVEIQKAGTKLNYSPNAFWWVSLPKNKWDDDPEEIKKIEKSLEAIWLPHPIGDKRQEIVFIGQSLPKQAIQEQLTSCLLSEEEFKVYLDTAGENIVDVFPKEWDELEKFFANRGIIREQDGEWEDEWE